MNKTIEALKLAEKTLEDIIRVYKFETGTPVTTLAAIREALAEQEKLVPKVSHGLCGGCAKTAADGWALYCVECWEKAEPVKQEPVYAFRRRGLDDFCTCTKERYEELADMPNLFEVTTFYAAPIDAKAIRALKLVYENSTSHDWPEDICEAIEDALK